MSSTNVVSLGRGHLFVQPMAEGGSVQEPCLKTIIILASFVMPAAQNYTLKTRSSYTRLLLVHKMTPRKFLKP